MKGILVPPSRRAEIRELHQNGTPVRKLAEKFDLRVATIYRILEEKRSKKKKRGRPQKLTSHQLLRLQTKFKRNPTESARTLADSITFPVSERTIRRELRKSGFHHKRLKPKKVLTKIHKQK